MTLHARALLAALLLAACTGDKPEGKAKNAEGESATSHAAVPVDVARVVKRSMPVELPAVGTVESIRSADVRARVSGEIERIWFIEGDEVEANAVLFTLDKRPFEAAVDAARSTLEGSRANAVNARKEANRLGRLVGKGYVTRQAYDTAVANAKNAEATLEADKARLETAELDLLYCTVRAPFAGKTGRYIVRTGDTVVANTDTLITLNEMKPVRVAFSVPGEQLARIQAQSKKHSLVVRATPLGADEKPPSGRLMFVDNRVSVETGTVLLKAQFPNDDERLWPGAFVDVVLILETQPDALVVPSSAVLAGQEGAYVFTVQESGAVEQTPVTVDRTMEELTVIARGLREGQTVVTDGQLRLTPGRKVKVRKHSEGADAQGGDER